MTSDCKKANISDRRAETYASRVGQMLVNVRRKMGPTDKELERHQNDAFHFSAMGAASAVNQ